MKTLIKFINLIRSSLRLAIHYRQFKKNASAVERFIGDSRECFVIGNGPSLTKSLNEHREKIAASKKICVNDMILTKEVQDIKPEYYLLLDPLYFASDASDDYIQLGKNVVQALESKVVWDMVLFIPHNMRHVRQFQDIARNNSHIAICYFNNTYPGTYSEVNHFFYDHNFGSPFSQNVLVAAIFLMLRLRFKAIYLLGADHSWLNNIVVTKDNVVCYQNSHFYDPNIAVKPFYKGDAANSVFSMKEILGLFSLMFEGYESLREYAKTQNAEILNATPGSYIDAFKKIDVIQ